MAERRCPKCENLIATEDKFCPNCGAVQPQEEAQLQEKEQPREKTQAIPPPVKRKRLEGGLLVEILVIVGFVTLGTLAIYALVSNVNTGDWRAFYGRITAPASAVAASKPASSPPTSAAPEPKSPVSSSTSAASSSASAASTPGAKSDEKPTRQKQPDVPLSDLPELPSTAPANAQIALKGGVKALSNNDLTTFVCTVENISGNICTGAGVEVELYDADSNCVDSYSAWTYRDIQPGEQVRLVFGGLSNPDVRAFCVTKVSSRSASDAVVPETANSPAKKETPAGTEVETPLSQGLTLLGSISKRSVSEVGFHLEGRIRNDSGKNYSSVFVDFVFYDAAGGRVGTATALTSDLDSGVVWEFSKLVMVAPQDAVSYKINDIRVY